MVLSLCFSVVWSLERLGERRKGPWDAVCKRKLLPLQGVRSCSEPSWGWLLLAEQGLCVGGKKGSGVPWASFQM